MMRLIGKQIMFFAQLPQQIAHQMQQSAALQGAESVVICKCPKGTKRPEPSQVALSIQDI